MISIRLLVTAMFLAIIGVYIANPEAQSPYTKYMIIFLGISLTTAWIRYFHRKYKEKRGY